MAKEQPGKGFAARLRAALDEAKGDDGKPMTQAELARRSGLSKQNISDLLLAKWLISGPSWEIVQKLAAALGVTCEAFVDPALAGQPTGKKPPRKKGK